MIIIRDFYCKTCDATEERYVDNSVRTVKCHDCGNEAIYRISPVRFKLEGVSGAFPSAYHSWDKRRQEKMKAERKQGYRPAGQDDEL